MTVTMEEYKRKMRDDNGLGLVRPEIPATTNIEFMGKILNMLKDIPYIEKDHEDAYMRIKKVLDIRDYFNIPNVIKGTIML